MTLKNVIRTMTMALVLSLSLTAVGQEQERSRPELPAGLKEAFRECKEELGLERPEPGPRAQAPSDEQRAIMDACLKEKGFEPPVRGFHRGEKKQASGVR